jgi:hypothetical protein
MGEAEPHPRATRSQRRRKKKNQHSLQEPENDNQPKKSNQPARRPQTRMNEPRKGGQEPYIQSKDLVVTAPPPLRSRHAAPATGRRPSRVHRQRPPAVGTRTRPEARRKREREREMEMERYDTQREGGGRGSCLLMLCLWWHSGIIITTAHVEKRGEERRGRGRKANSRESESFRLLPAGSSPSPQLTHHCPLLLATRAPSLALLWIRPVVMRCIC